MIAILEKYEHNVDFHHIVDFVEASHLRYALTINPTVYVSHIQQYWSTARIETTDEGTKILAIVDGKPKTIFESSIRRNFKLRDETRISSLPDAKLFKNLTLMGQYTRRTRISQYSALPTVVDEPASPLRDDSQGEACPTISGLKVEQDRANIIKTSTLPHDSPPSKYLNKWSLSECSPTAEIATVSIPPAGEIPIVSVPICSGVVPTASPIFTTATVATAYSRRKGKEKMVESKTPKKKKLQEQIDVKMDRQLEEEMVRDAKKMNEQIARDVEIARIHAEEELQMMIYGLDRSNEMIAKHLHEYEQVADELTIGEKIELINELVKYQDHHSKESAKKVKTSEEVSEEDLKTIMHLVPVEEVYVEALQLWVLVKETLNIRQATSDKEKELWVELKRLYESDVEDQLWTQTQALMHDPGYLLRKGLAIVMICNKLQVENYSQMASDLIQKIHKIANSPRPRSIPTASDEFPLSEDFPTASEERFPLLRKKDATSKKSCTVNEDKEFRKSSYCNIMYRTPCPIKGVLRFFDEVQFVFNLDSGIARGNSSYFSNDLKRSNITRVRLSSFAKTYHLFPLRYFQHDLISYLKLKRFSSYVGIALLTITGGLDTDLDLNYFLGHLVDDLRASELIIFNFSSADSRVHMHATCPPMSEWFSHSDHRSLDGHQPPHSPSQGGIESHSRSRLTTLTNVVVSYSALSDRECVVNSCDQ
nr:hypothetical protein [Tanacetum cinerariifolium]